MKINWRTAALAAILAAFMSLGSASAHAKNLTYSDLSDRIEALENELSSQRVQLASCDSSDKCCGSNDKCCGGSGAAYSAPASCSAWYVGYELTVLRPIISESNFAQAFDDEYGFGHRLVLGYDGGSGMGARMRYWFYNHGHDLIPAGAGSIGLDMDVFDAEITLQEQLRNWNLMVTGGARYGRVGITAPTGLGLNSATFEGAGPTVSLEAVRHFGDRGLYLIGNGRTSLLFGDIAVTGGASFEDDIVTVLESQLGVGFSRNLGGAILSLRTVWETQFWLNDSFFSSTDLGFAGPTSTIELKF